MMRMSRRAVLTTPFLAATRAQAAASAKVDLTLSLELTRAWKGEAFAVLYLAELRNRSGTPFRWEPHPFLSPAVSHYAALCFEGADGKRYVHEPGIALCGNVEMEQFPPKGSFFFTSNVGDVTTASSEWRALRHTEIDERRYRGPLPIGVYQVWARWGDGPLPSDALTGRPSPTIYESNRLTFSVVADGTPGAHAPRALDEVDPARLAPDSVLMHGGAAMIPTDTLAGCGVRTSVDETARVLTLRHGARRLSFALGSYAPASRAAILWETLKGEGPAFLVSLRYVADGLGLRVRIDPRSGRTSID